MESLAYILAGFLGAVNVALLILLFMTARRRSAQGGRPYEMLYRCALQKYSDLCHDYVNLLSCVSTGGFIPKRLLNRNPSVKEILPH